VIVEFLTVVLFGFTMEALDALGAQSFLDGWKSIMVVSLWFAAGFVAFLWVGSSLSLAIPCAALEELRAVRAIRRSWILSRGSRVRIAFTWVALAIASWMLQVSSLSLLRLVIVWIVRFTHERWIFYSLYPVMLETLNTSLTAIVGPIYPIALTLFYYDQRIRREGYDIERLMDAAGMSPQIALPAEDSSLESV